MNNKKWGILSVLIILVFLILPGTAFAEFDEYGYNAQGRMYQGTLDNWEAFLMGQPPVSYDKNGTNIVFVNRKWNQDFEDLMFHNMPPVDGAWQTAELYEYLSGDQFGWTWHYSLEIVYSSVSIPGAIEVPEESVGMKGFYFTKSEEWLSCPGEEDVIIQGMSLKPSIINRALHSLKK